MHRLGLKGSWAGCWPESPSYLLYQLPPTSAQRPFSPVHTHTVCMSMLLYTGNRPRAKLLHRNNFDIETVLAWADFEKFSSIHQSSQPTIAAYSNMLIQIQSLPGITAAHCWPGRGEPVGQHQSGECRAWSGLVLVLGSKCPAKCLYPRHTRQ